MNYTIDELKVGQFSSYSKTITETDVYLFAGITGDFNPAHMNSEYAKSTAFKERIAHGMLSASLISTVLGTNLPGKRYDLYGAKCKVFSTRTFWRYYYGYGGDQGFTAGKKQGGFTDLLCKSGR